MVGAITATILKRAAEGRFGPLVQKLYWGLAGAKTWTAIVFAFLAGVAEVAARSGLCAYLGIGPECEAVAHAIAQGSATVALGFGYLGQVDGALRSAAPSKE